MQKKTLILMRGLPYSGKSTKARSYGCPVVSPDAFRKVITGQTSYAPAEPIVWAHVNATILHFFEQGYEQVVLDADHSLRRIEEWRKRGTWDILIDTLDTSVEDCVKRAGTSGRSDLIPKIIKIAAFRNCNV